MSKPSIHIAITITSAPKPVTFAVANPRASAPPPHSCTETQRYKGCRAAINSRRLRAQLHLHFLAARAVQPFQHVIPT